MIRRALRSGVAVLLAMVVGCGIVAATTGPAAAGGPTSVLLVAPDLERTAGLFVSDQRYQVLAGTIGMTMGNGIRDSAPGGVKGGPELHAGGPAITVTWLIHGVSVWRVDRIYLEADGGPWIATQVISGEGDLFSQPVTWRTSPEAGRLIQLMGELGLLAADTPALATLPPQAASPDAAAAAPGDAPAAPTVAGTASLSGWRWSVPGFAVGALAVLLAVSLTPAWRHRDRTPRWQLIDDRD